MTAPQDTSALPAEHVNAPLKESQIELSFIKKLRSLKYTHRLDIRDRASLEKNFREKFEALNRVSLGDNEFARLREEIINPDVFTAARILRGYNSFSRADGTPLNYTLVVPGGIRRTQFRSGLSTPLKQPPLRKAALFTA